MDIIQEENELVNENILSEAKDTAATESTGDVVLSAADLDYL